MNPRNQVQFLPENTVAMGIVSTGDVQVKVWMCMVCGAIELFGSLKQADKRLGCK